MKKEFVLFGLLVLLSASVYSINEESVTVKQVGVAVAQQGGPGEQSEPGQPAGVGPQTTGQGQGIMNQTMNQSQTMNQTPGQGGGVPTQNRNQTMNQTLNQTGTMNQSMTQNQTRIRNITADIDQIQDRIRNQSRILNQSIADLPEQQQLIQRQENQVRLAVQTMLDLQNLSNNSGPQIAQIANEYSNAIQATVQTEEQIQARSGFTRFLFGGDENAARQLEQQIIMNQERIRLLTQYMNECNCDPAVKALLQQQIQTMQEEQTRLQTLAQNELADKGILGWLFK